MKVHLKKVDHLKDTISRYSPQDFVHEKSYCIAKKYRDLKSNLCNDYSSEKKMTLLLICNIYTQMFVKRHCLHCL